METRVVQVVVVARPELAFFVFSVRRCFAYLEGGIVVTALFIASVSVRRFVSHRDGLPFMSVFDPFAFNVSRGWFPILSFFFGCCIDEHAVPWLFSCTWTVFVPAS